MLLFILIAALLLTLLLLIFFVFFVFLLLNWCYWKRRWLHRQRGWCRWRWCGLVFFLFVLVFFISLILLLVLLTLLLILALFFIFLLVLFVLLVFFVLLVCLLLLVLFLVFVLPLLFFVLAVFFVLFVLFVNVDLATSTRTKDLSEYGVSVTSRSRSCLLEFFCQQPLHEVLLRAKGHQATVFQALLQVRNLQFSQRRTLLLHRPREKHVAPRPSPPRSNPKGRQEPLHPPT
mmetsp:Transcript_81565/g.212156  ORF Transcript_81565/g.212156 Transcript_81565/m.212156 type:complete len:232 (+) Transcript_81565:2819-3514(+)